MDWSKHTTTANGIRIAYRELGPTDMPPLVLLHALGEDSGDWEPIADQFAERFRLLAIDLRGHGDTDWPGTYTVEAMRDDVIAFLDAQDLSQVTLLGHSLGGMVALRVAAHAPDRIEQLVVEDAVPPYPRDRPVPDQPDEPVPFDWAVVPAFLGSANDGDPAAWAALEAITAPTLIVGGGPESHIPQELLARAASAIPTCDLVTVSAGHHVHRARPSEFTEAVLAWLSSPEPRPR